MKKTGAIVLALGLLWTSSAFAGYLLVATCSSCGYQSEELEYGYGESPVFCRGIYSSADWGVVLVVRFNLALMMAKNLGVDLGDAGYDQFLEFINKNKSEYKKLKMTWFPVREILAGDLPVGAEVFPPVGFSGVPPALTLIDNPLDELYLCPQCGKRTLSFKIVGNWN
jgi:hypothetical protein